MKSKLAVRDAGKSQTSNNQKIKLPYFEWKDFPVFLLYRPKVKHTDKRYTIQTGLLLKDQVVFFSVPPQIFIIPTQSHTSFWTSAATENLKFI